MKIQVLHAIGEAVQAAHKVLASERGAGVKGEKLTCIVEHVEKLEALYDECIQCCLEDVRG
ncbi:MAG: hypothetical protein U9Q76_07775 [candidate division WOR-3 bacterium]|nr:hypothetical protein [candidate division WOR-3 bacterium]